MRDHDAVQEFINMLIVEKPPSLENYTTDSWDVFNAGYKVGFKKAFTILGIKEEFKWSIPGEQEENSS